MSAQTPLQLMFEADASHLNLLCNFTFAISSDKVDKWLHRQVECSRLNHQSDIAPQSNPRFRGFYPQLLLNPNTLPALLHRTCVSPTSKRNPPTSSCNLPHSHNISLQHRKAPQPRCSEDSKNIHSSSRETSCAV